MAPSRRNPRVRRGRSDSRHPGKLAMADLKPQVYKDPRPAEYFDRFHERARTREPDWVYDVARIILTPPVLVAYRSGRSGRRTCRRRAR